MEAEDAANRGFGDAVTLGTYEPVGAATGAGVGLLGDLGRGRSFKSRYDAIRSGQRLQDAYDALHHPLARNLGELAGAGTVVYLTDGIAAAPSAARLAPLAPRILGAGVKPAVKALRPWAAAASAGSALSLAGQATSDLGAHRLSGPQAYIGSAIGGAAGGVATFKRSPSAAAAVETMVSSGVQSALTGKPMRPEDIAKNAIAGGYLGLLGHIGGFHWSDGLSSFKKGKLGESLSVGKAKIMGDKIVRRERPRRRGHTRADFVMPGDLLVESKFGRKAPLRPLQIKARETMGPLYRIEHFLPDDIGKAVGGLLGTFSARTATRTDRQ
jgi:hypothetical protein